MASRIDQDMGSQRAGGTLEDGLVTGAELDTLLRRRASELVASQNQARQRNLIPEQLSARIGEESYGLPLTSVVRIVPNTGCAAAPGGRWPLLGIHGSQGDSWALYDLGGLLGGSLAAGGNDRKRVGEGQRGAVRLVLGGSPKIKKKKEQKRTKC